MQSTLLLTLANTFQNTIYIYMYLCLTHKVLRAPMRRTPRANSSRTHLDGQHLRGFGAALTISMPGAVSLVLLCARKHLYTYVYIHWFIRRLACEANLPNECRTAPCTHKKRAPHTKKKTRNTQGTCVFFLVVSFPD